MEILYHNITGGIRPIEVNIFESYGQPVSRCEIVTDDPKGIGLGDQLSIDIGFDSSHGVVFRGYVQNIISERLPGQYVIEASDILIRAAEHMIVSTDLDNPFSRRNISMEDLVGDLLAEAGITNYVGDTSGFTLATGDEPATFQLVFALDAVQQVANIIAWHVYADHTGTVYFKDIKPYPSGSPVASYTVGSSGNILVARYSKSTDKLRNKVVVFGKPPIYAERSASSPYLPSGFYKTAIISTPLIDTQSMANTSAEYNLTAWNRLTENMSVDALGDWRRHARQTVSVVEPFTGVNSNWFIHDITHTFGTSYVIRMNLVR